MSESTSFLTEDAKRFIINHMNERDHLNHLLLYCHVFKNRPDVTFAEMVSVDETGFELKTNTDEILRLEFPKKIESRGDVRKFMVDMVSEAQKIKGVEPSVEEKH
eukprot:TRINITY_DN15945_c0_g1_i1.p2 TRINITY_DN15945_c0_g1~~TRINITY_DN15945_c0_g1_i1.p2  ORF type:complete len:105 (+),score=26.25 TRINITY_DN15945_c0_g1_i1:48-362(+)